MLVGLFCAELALVSGVQAGVLAGRRCSGMESMSVPVRRDAE